MSRSRTALQREMFRRMLNQRIVAERTQNFIQVERKQRLISSIRSWPQQNIPQTPLHRRDLLKRRLARAVRAQNQHIVDTVTAERLALAREVCDHRHGALRPPFKPHQLKRHQIFVPVQGPMTTAGREKALLRLVQILRPHAESLRHAGIVLWKQRLARAQKRVRVKWM